MTLPRLALQFARSVARRQRGGLLVETVIALSVLGVLGTVVLSGVQTSYTAKRHFEARSIAENLVRSQIEHVMQQAYQPPGAAYPTITPPSGYSVSAETLTYDAASPNIAIVRVTVRQGNNVIKVFDTLRTDR